jgi:hypothetical protein
VRRIVLNALSVLPLLVPNLAFADAAASTREFVDGERQTYSTLGHPKASGVHVTIAYPGSWKAQEGNRPEMVAMLVSEGGRGLEMVALAVVEIPFAPGTVFSEQDQRDYLTSPELKDALPPGAKLIDAGSTTVDGLSAGILEYTWDQQHAGVNVHLRVWSLFFFAGNNTNVQVQFQVGGVAGSEPEIARRMAAFKPLFAMMAGTIDLPDRPAATTPAPPAIVTPARPAALPLPDPPHFLPAFLGNILMTWGLGLAPAVLIRYGFVGRPLRPSTASWIAGGFCAFFWILFQVTNRTFHERPGVGAVWLLVFVVARWIMSRDVRAPAPSAPRPPA